MTPQDIKEAAEASNVLAYLVSAVEALEAKVAALEQPAPAPAPAK